MVRIVFMACVAATFAAALCANAQVAMLDMTAADVAELLAQAGVYAPQSVIDPSHDGAALVDFARWYDSMPPIARFIQAQDLSECKAWPSVARWMENKRQMVSAAPDNFWEWHSHNLRLADMWMLPLTLHPPSALLWAALGNVSSSASTLAPIRAMSKLELLLKWLLIPSYPLLKLSVEMLHHSNYIWILVLHFGVLFMSDALAVLQLVCAFFRGSKTTKSRVISQTVDEIYARLPRAIYTFSHAAFAYFILWHIIPLHLIRLPMYSVFVAYAFFLPYTAYFVLVEFGALFTMSRKGPDFDADLRVRPFNPAILSGATDVIAVKQADGSIRTSPFHVRFGWLSGVFRGGDVVNVYINGAKCQQRMVIGSNGVAHFEPENVEINFAFANLKSDENRIIYSPQITFCGQPVAKFVSRFLKIEIQAFLHLWQQHDQVVICDIDGTITKTDSSGHLFFWARKFNLPYLSSKDFTHPHVVELLSAVSKQKYKIMYLTARNIGYANQTKSYIHGMFSSGQRLPRGPVITSHSGLIAALSLEIVLKRPDEFKIAELSHIRALFSSKCSQCHQANSDSVTPFYAGFGNRPTDTKSYKRVGVATERIFIVDVRGTVTVSPECKGGRRVTFENYGAVANAVQQYFPVPKLM